MIDAQSRPTKTVLLVDDEPANVRILAEVLKGDYHLVFATSGARAIELASASPVDLVLLDVQMPGLDGIEVCRRLKADPKTQGIPVIFVTALGEVDDETRGFDAGGVDYITKPISPPVVKARVKTHVELKEARDRLEILASLDALTGLANRRQFDVHFDHEWRRAMRGRSWLSLAILDVDHFKKFNDHYGHARGDDCLRTLAQALAGVCRRPADLAARYGGEEFALVLPDTDPAGARGFALSVLSRIDGLGIAHAASPVAAVVSASLGAVSLVPSGEISPEGALEVADQLLYDAKAAGRRQALHLDFATGEKERLSSLGRRV